MKRLALLVVLFIAGCGGGSGSFDGTPDFSEPAAMMLRLSDLPEGFRYGDDRGCGETGTTEGQEPELDAFLIETRPRACFGDFAREWGGPPESVQSALFLFDTDEDARRAWTLRKALFQRFGGIFVTTERTDGETVVFDSRGLNFPGVGEAWRDGRLVVAVYEEGLSGEDGDEFARRLAEDQRRRIESPSDPSEEDDRELGLEDPAIAIPVYWLGREFEPDGLPKLELDRGDRQRDDGAGSEVTIDYQGEGGGVKLDLWKPESRALLEPTRCAHRSGLRVAGGRAEIHGGCDGKSDRWLAHVSYNEVVVVVTPNGAYNSREGMDAVVRGLERR